MSSVTITTTTTRRARSLSLFASTAPQSQPAFLRIPNELILDILDTSILDSKASAFTLARVCKTLCTFIDTLLYRTVILDTPSRISLFYRTVKTKSNAFLQRFVKEIAVTCEPVSYNYGAQAIQQVAQIIYSCTGLRRVAVPTPFELAYLHPPSPPLFNSGPSEIIIDTFIASNYAHLSASLSPTTHLRICEPSDGWVSPSTIMSTFGPLPQLTHLQLPRRAEANEDNDFTFAQEVREILASRPNIKMLAVSVFPLDWSEPSSAKESHIWDVLSEIQKEDPRLALVVGGYGEWRSEWQAPAFLPRKDFWSTCAARAEVDDASR